MRLTLAAEAALLAELGRLLVGGVLQVYSGEPPARAGETPQTATLLVEHNVRSAAMTEQGLEAQLASAVGRATGMPRWFQARAAGGTVLKDGLVGNGPNQLRIEPQSIIQGGRVDAQAYTVAWKV